MNVSLGLVHLHGSRGIERTRAGDPSHMLRMIELKKSFQLSFFPVSFLFFRFLFNFIYHTYTLPKKLLVVCCFLTSVHEFSSLKHTHRIVHSYW